MLLLQVLQVSHASMTFRKHVTGGQAQTSNVQHVEGGIKEKKKMVFHPKSGVAILGDPR